MMLPGGGLCSVTYKASWENQPKTIYQWSYNSPNTWEDDDPSPQSVFSYTVDLRSAPIGPQHVEVKVTGVGYLYGITQWFYYTGSGSSSVHFIIADTSPEIDVISPENKEYTTNSVPLVFYTKEETSWFGYSLDNVEMVTVNGNTTLAGLSDGYHSIVVYANGTKWNTGKSSETVFKVNTHPGGNNSIPTSLWKTNIAWNPSGTSAQDLWEKDIRFKTMTWTTPTAVDDILFAGLISAVTLESYGSLTIAWIDIYAFNATSGTEIWKYRIDISNKEFFGGPTISSLAVADGKVFFGIEDTVYALSASMGTLLWNRTVGVGKSSPVVVDKVVFIGSSALNANNGDIIWNTNVGNVAWSTPAVANGIVYIGSFEGMHALNALTGARIWDYYGEDFHGTYTVADNVVYASSSWANIYAFDATNGAKLWNYSFWDGSHMGPSLIVMRDDNLYVTYRWSPAELFALNAKNGDRLWSVTLGNEISPLKFLMT